MRILMSIQTTYARKIFSGRKRWEFRKSIPREAAESPSPVVVVVYSSGEDRAIIGEFKIGRVVKTSFPELMRLTGMKNDADAVRWLSEYYKNRRVCSAIQVGNFRLYANAIRLDELQRRVPEFRPPQNFIYLHNHPAIDRELRMNHDSGN